jgi:hypothetical protein
MSKIVNRRNALLGWIVWLVAKRQLRKKARKAMPLTGDEPRRGRLVPLVLGLATAIGLVVLWRKLRGGETEEWRAPESAASSEPTPLVPLEDDDVPPAA